MTKNSPKTLLINPPITTEELYGKFTLAGADHAPPGLCYIASYLLKHGKPVNILDAAKLRLGSSGIKKAIAEFAPDLIAFHVCTPNINTVKSLSREIKSLWPDIMLVAGGPHFFYCPEDDLYDSGLDIIVIGEGEATCLEIVERLEREGRGNFSAGDIDGIVYRNNGNIAATSQRKLIEDIDSIPLPARHLLPPLDSYKSSLATYKKLPSTIMSTSRGCPFSCSFCHNSIPRIPRMRYHSDAYVMSEVDELVGRYGIRDITFVDEIFPVDKERTYRICEGFARRKDKLSWVCNVRVGTADKKMLKCLKDSGCWLVMIGIDSGSQGVLDKMEKGFKLEEARDLCEWCKDAGLMVHPNFIIGNPGDTEETINETIRFARSLYSHYPVFTLMVPYPGTKLWAELGRFGELKDRNFDIFTFGSQKRCFVPFGLSEELLLAKRDQAYKECYLNYPMFMRHLRALESPQDVIRALKAARVLAGL